MYKAAGLRDIARRILTAQVLGIFLASSLLPGWAAAAPDTPPPSLAQTPQFLGKLPAPNLFLTMDDSGSMAWEFLPDGMLGNSLRDLRLFPVPYDNLYEPSNPQATSVVSFVDFQAGNLAVARLRSSAFNLLYYDPAVTYVPWDGVDKAGNAFTDADPEKALYHPYHPEHGALNLKATSVTKGALGIASLTDIKTYRGTTLDSRAADAGGNASYSWGSGSMAVYYQLKSGMDGTDYSHFDRIEITDALGLKNFANWFTYYRSRTLAARGATGRAFFKLNGDYRVGLGRLNGGSGKLVEGIDLGTGHATLDYGVRNFTGTDRAKFYSLLYDHQASGGTPARRALDDVGLYFSESGKGLNGPWGDDPANGTGRKLACRLSFNVFVTDGYWNGAAATNATGNVDGNDGPEILPPTDSNNDPYQYLASSATNLYKDSASDTLADVAMYYWYRDLQDDVPNKVPTSTADPAYWQHLSLFGIALGKVGSKTNDPNFLSNADQNDDSWPDPITPNEESPRRIDDLWHATVNSRGAFFTAKNPNELYTQLSQTLQEIGKRKGSGSAAASSSGMLQTDTGLYTADFVQGEWSGDLYRRELDSNLQFKVVNGNPWIWRVSDKLPTDATSAAARNVLTMTPTGNVVRFTWSDLDATQKAELGSADVVNYLRGDPSQELPAGNFRDRPHALGDIVNSSPVFVGNDDFGYQFLPLGDPGRSSYRKWFLDNTQETGGRTNVIAVGANDGMFHLFDASPSATVGGRELLAYVPRAVIKNLVQLTDPGYVHRYYVDGVPAVGDAYLGSEWRTIVFSSLGAGGRSVFAIDATHKNLATGLSFGTGSVIGEWDETNLGANFPYLGHVIGPATIGRLKDGSWVAVFGNGPESDNKEAALFVINLATGAVRVISTNVGTPGEPNGLFSPVPLFDNNRNIVAVYAGDLQGNLWKFDLINKEVAYGGQPLFVAERGSLRQPITARPRLRDHKEGILVFFGTGKLYGTGDRDNKDVQSQYAVLDRESGVGLPLTRASLVQQAIQSLVSTPARTFYQFETPATVTLPAARGWFFDLGATRTGDVLTAGERMVSQASIVNDRLVTFSYAPPTDECDFGGLSFIYITDLITGTVFQLEADRVDGLTGLTTFYQPNADASKGFDALLRPTCIDPATCPGPRTISPSEQLRIRTWRHFLD